MITVRRDAVRTQGRAPKGGGDQRDREAVGSSSRLAPSLLDSASGFVQRRFL
jgi:hypothetical protein